MNNPDIYMAGGSLDGTQAGLRARPLPSQPTILSQQAPVAPITDTLAAVAVPVAPAAQAPDPDESPATIAKLTPPPKENSVEAPKEYKKVTSGEASLSPGDIKTDYAETSRKDAA